MNLNSKNMEYSGNEIVKTIIKNENITQRELATKLNVSEQLVSKWVNHENTPTNKTLLALVLEFRSINPYWILTGEGNYDNTDWSGTSKECKGCEEKEKMIGFLEDHLQTLKDQIAIMKAHMPGYPKAV